MNDFFTNNKWLMLIVGLAMAAAGYWQAIHIETWAQILTVQNICGLILTLGGVLVGNHASSVFVQTGGKQ